SKGAARPRRAHLADHSVDSRAAGPLRSDRSFKIVFLRRSRQVQTATPPSAAPSSFSQVRNRELKVYVDGRQRRGPAKERRGHQGGKATKTLACRPNWR